MNISEVKSICLCPRRNNDPVDVSIIIPTYKRAKFLSEAIESAIDQDPSGLRYEIIVVNNDCASDMKEEIERFRVFPNISFYKNEENIGMFNNWNRGAELAEGKYAAFLHDDDILFPNYMRCIEQALADLKDVHFGALIPGREAFGKAVRSGKLKKKAKEILYDRFYLQMLLRSKYKDLSPESALKLLPYNIYHAPTCGTLFEKDDLLARGGWNQDYYPAADLIYFLQVNKDKIVRCIREKTGAYRWEVNEGTRDEVIEADIRLRLKLIDYEYSDRELAEYFRRNRDMLRYLVLDVPNNAVREKLISELDQPLKEPSKISVFLFLLYRKLYIMLNGLNY